MTEAPDCEEALPVPGLSLHVEHFDARGAALGVVVFVHGFAAHSGPYRPLAAALAADRLAVTMFDCRGHGRSGGRRAYVARFDDYLDDLAAVARRARERVPGLPVAFVGHSHGATIVLDYLLRREELPACAVAATPWLALRMKVPWWKRALAAPLARIAPALPLHNEIHATEVSRSPDVVASFDRDPLVLHVATPRWFREARAAQSRILAARDALRVPTLVLIAGDDHIVSSDATLAWTETAGPAVSVRRYAELYHEVLREPEREHVIADVRAWLHTTLGGTRDLARARHDVPGIL